MFDTSKDEDEQQPVPDDMDMMNDNMDLSSNNLELEPVAQEIDETVDVNQLDVNELTRSINQLLIDRNSGNLTQTFDITVLPQKKSICRIKMENESPWLKCQVISRIGKATGKQKYFLNILNCKIILSRTQIGRQENEDTYQGHITCLDRKNCR